MCCLVGRPGGLGWTFTCAVGSEIRITQARRPNNIAAPPDDEPPAAQTRAVRTRVISYPLVCSFARFNATRSSHGFLNGGRLRPYAYSRSSAVRSLVASGRVSL